MIGGYQYARLRLVQTDQVRCVTGRVIDLPAPSSQLDSVALVNCLRDRGCPGQTNKITVDCFQGLDDVRRDSVFPEQHVRKGVKMLACRVRRCQPPNCQDRKSTRL